MLSLYSFDHNAAQPLRNIARQQMLQRTASPPLTPRWQETLQCSKLLATKYSRQNMLSFMEVLLQLKQEIIPKVGAENKLQ